MSELIHNSGPKLPNNPQQCIRCKLQLVGFNETPFGVNCEIYVNTNSDNPSSYPMVNITAHPDDEHWEIRDKKRLGAFPRCLMVSPNISRLRADHTTLLANKTNALAKAEACKKAAAILLATMGNIEGL